MNYWILILSESLDPRRPSMLYVFIEAVVP
jgi:hypothetical protein